MPGHPFTTDQGGKEVSENKPPKLTETPEFLELEELVCQAESGDKAAVFALGKALKPESDLWKAFRELANAAEEASLQLDAGDDPELRARLLGHAGHMKRDLTGPHPTPVEHLLASLAAACWLQRYHYDHQDSSQSPGIPPAHS